MKRFWLLASVLALVASPSAASSIAFGVGYWDTEGAADDNGATVRLSLDAGEHWNIDLRGSFFDGHAFVLGPRTFELEATPIDLGLSYRFKAGGKATPYVGAGLSYTLFKSTVFNTATGGREASRIEDEPGLYGVAGVEATLTSHVGVFAEVLYRQTKATVEGDGVAGLASVALDLVGAGAALGLCFSW